MAKAAAVEKPAVDEKAETVDTSEDLEALKARIKELEAGQAPKRVVDYEWPKPTAEQAGRNIVGGEAAVRVLKVTYADESKQFWDNSGVKTVHIGQFRYPRAGKQWDEPRLVMELKKEGLILIEEAFSEAKHYCELNNCWSEAAFDGFFCHPKHRDIALNAHDRFISFE